MQFDFPFIIQCFACVMATVFFGALLRQPRNTLILTAAIALVAFIVFFLLNQTLLAFFISGLIAGIASEIIARVKKMATTLFLISSIIPIVPGLGLYKTIMFLVNNQLDEAASMGINTLAGTGAIAMALTITTFVFNTIHLHKPKGATHASATHQ